ncbi:MAG: 4a-hydroxytetrahydrobiopterin dehydratase [Candidatus Vogelbacteria bacterium CG10_big_fil_rev_8_21_14_0_10_49_38]|uniref:Putative pterin-4-alpha-carbinolamine dehydratase n=1 Tax=Candidatus Vogelbacteria bacterium CG10_big_fil_rev_8_21_14_0_10_49_38 TaxID=1975043 RepID=A0A2H0RHS3_9BACT|nr:MAG: 4a-hydroxytetrahydrobiopterin dehydratase [Candidatus Vogelbacteria bacterium CG10_big_fil_rev_8_21_14_0_10_49_38]
MKLTEQKCRPCEGLADKLSPELIQTYLGQIEGWRLAPGAKIVKEYVLADFAAALKFVNAIGATAEAEGHHPDLSISYDKVAVSLWTHALNGLSVNDFILAAKIDKLFQPSL